jgi:hypothetical protein
MVAPLNDDRFAFNRAAMGSAGTGAKASSQREGLAMTKNALNASTTDVSINGAANNHTLELVLKGGAELSAAVAELVTKAEEVAAGPISVLNIMRRIFGDDGLRDEFPRLGTKDTDDDIGNAYAETYKAMVPDASGERKSKNVNFFTVFWRETPKGKEHTFQAEQVALALGKDPTKAEKLYRDMPRRDLENLKKKLNHQLAQGRGYIRKAVGVWHVWQDLLEHTDEDGKPYVELDYSDNNVRGSKYPLDLVDNKKRGKFRPMSVGDVLKLDVDAAIEMGGDLYDNLETQLSRDTNNKKDGKYPVPGNVDDATNCMAALLNYIDADSEDGEQHTSDLKEMMTKKKGGEELILQVGSLIRNLRGMWTEGLQTTYARLIDKQVAARAIEDKPTEVTAKVA